MGVKSWVWMLLILFSKINVTGFLGWILLGAFASRVASFPVFAKFEVWKYISPRRRNAAPAGGLCKRQGRRATGERHRGRHARKSGPPRRRRTDGYRASRPERVVE